MVETHSWGAPTSLRISNVVALGLFAMVVFGIWSLSLATAVVFWSSCTAILGGQVLWMIWREVIR